MSAGEPHGLVPAGLAARDTLRLEAGMPLYGHELTLETLPSQAGLGRVVVIAKDEFVGKEALVAVERAGASDRPRAGRPRRRGQARRPRRLCRRRRRREKLGEITSGALSPTLGHPIAMAYVHPSSAEEGTAVFLDVRGTKIPATVTALPFYRRTK